MPSENFRNFFATAVSADHTPRPSTITLWGIRLRREEGCYLVTYLCQIISMYVEPWKSAIRTTVSLHLCLYFTERRCQNITL